MTDAKQAAERMLPIGYCGACNEPVHKSYCPYCRTELTMEEYWENETYKQRLSTLAQPQAQVGDETGWLIEHGLREAFSGVLYWCGEGEWNGDSLKAIRFARREDANKMVDILMRRESWRDQTKYHRVAEHKWLSGLRAAQPVVTEEVVKLLDAIEDYADIYRKDGSVVFKQDGLWHCGICNTAWHNDVLVSDPTHADDCPILLAGKVRLSTKTAAQATPTDAEVAEIEKRLEEDERTAKKLGMTPYSLTDRRTLLRIIKSRPASQGWRTDIENAPDAIIYLAKCNSRSKDPYFVGKAVWKKGDDEVFQEGWWDDSATMYVEPIGWQPLPAPPKSEKP